MNICIKSQPFFQPGEQDEKFRKLQYEKDNLQLQVQVLTEQIEAQSDKISDLEKMLQEKKQLLSETEDKLQRVSQSLRRDIIIVIIFPFYGYVYQRPTVIDFL